MADARAVALGDQMHARMMDEGMAQVLAALTAEGLTPSEDETDYLHIGIAAGTRAAMNVLMDMGLLRRG